MGNRQNMNTKTSIHKTKAYLTIHNLFEGAIAH